VGKNEKKFGSEFTMPYAKTEGMLFRPAAEL